MAKETDSLEFFITDSDILKIKVKEEGKRYRIDLAKELQLQGKDMLQQIKKNPSSYAVVTFLRNKALQRMRLLEKEKDRIFSGLYLSAMDGEYSRVTKEYANHKANNNRSYQEALEKFINAEKIYMDLNSVCEAYKQRHEALKSMSFSLRDER